MGRKPTKTALDRICIMNPDLAEGKETTDKAEGKDAGCIAGPGGLSQIQ